MRIQTYVDPKAPAALHATLQKKKNAKRRAALVKTFAERHLTGVQKVSPSTGDFEDDVTYPQNPDKLHSSEMLLTGTLPVSNTPGTMLLIGKVPVSNISKNGRGEPAETDEARAQAAVEANLLLSAKMPLSNNSTGADALPSVLSDRMLGFRR